jgi:UDP-glucose 4-epimerase
MNPNLIKEDAPLRIRPDYKYIKDRVEAEELVKKFAKKNPNTKVFILRKCPALGDKVKNFMTWYVSGAIICSVLGFDPMMQFIHQEDLIESHFKVALLDEAPGGIYNIAGRGALPLSYITRLMGKINIPLIYSFAYLLFYILRVARIAPFPPQHIDYIRFTFVADGTKAKENLGFIPKYSTKEVVEEFAGYVKLKKARIKQD